MVSQQAHLYAHHLSQCPSYSAAHHTVPGPNDENNLPQLRRLFAREIKRNLFEAYLRPQETIINLVSTSISSSSAPGGEAFHFSLSPGGHYVLAYSSSRIHVLDVTGPEVTVKRELKILRRPASTTITDDGNLLAVLSTDLQVNLYDLTGEYPKHIRAVALDYTPRTISLSPTGSVLAAAYESGIEVSSLDPDCVTTERRAVKCYAADSLSFSKSGTQLLGTTVQSQNPSTVVVTAPYYDPSGSLPKESISALWTTSILFPNGSRDCSHAVLLPTLSNDEASWTFTYDRVFETFRAVRVDESLLRNGTTYFPGPVADSPSKLLPSTLPTASKAGDLVAAGFQESIWLYGIPEDLEALPNVNSGTNSSVESEISVPLTHGERRNSASSLRSVPNNSQNNRIPQWQVLCDKARDTFVEGRKISSLDRVSAMTWVNDWSTSFHKERLVAVAPGVGCQSPEIDRSHLMSPVDGGRMSILDFDYSLSNGKKRTVTIEVGAKEPDTLEEEHRDLDTEVALARRRTVAQRRRSRSSVARSATAVGGSVAGSAFSAIPPMPPTRDLGDPFDTPALRRFSLAVLPTDTLETASIDEEQEALDGPYSHTSPRSGTTLRRAATAAAASRRFHPRAVAQEHIEYRRADGREEHPHESDADNWVPPPPPYTKDPVPPLPEHIQRSLLAEAAAATLQRANTQRAPTLDFPGLDTPVLQRSRTLGSVSSSGSRREFPFPRTRSHSTMRTIAVSVGDEQRPATSPASPVSPMFDDLYNVSPPGSPQPTHDRAPTPPTPQEVAPPTPPTPLTPQSPPVDSHTESEPSPLSVSTPPPTHQIPRKPVGADASNIVEVHSAPAEVARATMHQSIQPAPQPVTDSLGRLLGDGETTTEAREVPLSDMSLTSAPSGPTRERMEEEAISHPSEGHNITELPQDTSVQQHGHEDVQSQPASPLRRSETAPSARSPASTGDELMPVSRTNTAPVASETLDTSINTTTRSRIMSPSADQLARLNSRSGRPAGIVDPRRLSGTFTQPRGTSRTQRHSWTSSQHTPLVPSSEQDFGPSPPSAAVGARRSLARSNTTYVPSSRPYAPPSASFSRRISINAPSHHRHTSSGSSLWPVQRLDTIQSANSTAEPSPWPLQKPIPVGVSRQSSRAERSAAKNIKDAKKRGWRASIRKESNGKNKGKAADGTSDSGMKRIMGRERRKKHGAKCAMM